MRFFHFEIHGLSLVTAAIVASLLAGVRTASAVDVFFEDFEDATLAEFATQGLGTIANGIISYNDTSTTTRHRFVVRPGTPPATAPWTDPVLTYSFDIKAPMVIPGGGTDELRFRAGIGNADNTLQAADFIYEVLLHSNGTNSGAYLNSGNETAFLVANNQNSTLNFTSPIDSSNVALNAYQYVAYVRNNATNAFGQLKGISNMVDLNGATDGVGSIARFGIGSSSNAHTGTFAMDNVLVVTGVSFQGSIPPIVGDVDGDGIGGEFPDDFEPIRANFRKSPRSRSQGDLTGDGLVSLPDFTQWKGVFLGGGGSATGLDMSFLGVPEPSSIALVFVFGLVMAGCRSRRRAR